MSNPVGNGCQHGTADVDDGDSVGYLMRRRKGYWHNNVVLTVIVAAAEMDGAIDVGAYIA